jgi:hypothetical protein
MDFLSISNDTMLIICKHLQIWVDKIPIDADVIALTTTCRHFYKLRSHVLFYNKVRLYLIVNLSYFNRFTNVVASNESINNIKEKTTKTNYPDSIIISSFARRSPLEGRSPLRGRSPIAGRSPLNRSLNYIKVQPIKKIFSSNIEVSSSPSSNDVPLSSNDVPLSSNDIPLSSNDVIFELGKTKSSLSSPRGSEPRFSVARSENNAEVPLLNDTEVPLSNDIEVSASNDIEVSPLPLLLPENLVELELKNVEGNIHKLICNLRHLKYLHLLKGCKITIDPGHLPTTLTHITWQIDQELKSDILPEGLLVLKVNHYHHHKMILPLTLKSLQIGRDVKDLNFNKITLGLLSDGLEILRLDTEVEFNVDCKTSSLKKIIFGVNYPSLSGLPALPANIDVVWLNKSPQHTIIDPIKSRSNRRSNRLSSSNPADSLWEPDDLSSSNPAISRKKAMR